MTVFCGIQDKTRRGTGISSPGFHTLKLTNKWTFMRVNAQHHLIGSVKNEDFIFSVSLFHNFLLNIFDYLQL